MSNTHPQTSTITFRISDVEFERRNKRILYGLAWSIGLAVLVSIQHLHYPENYNDALFWSVIGFVALANLVNYYRHRKYIIKARTHRIELTDKTLRFITGSELSELKLPDVAAMSTFNQGKRLGHIQLKLRNGRGIRLEGYDDMDGLTAALQKRLPDKQMNF
jgi:hypothetical protein